VKGKSIAWYRGAGPEKKFSFGKVEGKGQAGQGEETVTANLWEGK